MVDITFYGGVNEIGGNKVLIKAEKGSIFLDFGLTYKGEGDFFEEFLQPRTNSKFYDLGKLGLLPKVNGIYRKDILCPEGLDNTCTPTPDYWESGLKSYEKACQEETWYPNAVFISHAHADHNGYLPYLGDIPVYSSETSKKLMKATSQIGNLNGYDGELIEYNYRKIGQNKKGYFPNSHKIVKEDPQERTFEILTSGVTKNISENLNITGFAVGHSIPGSMCCLVEADGKQIFYTGDIRFHGRDKPDLTPVYDLKPDVMITEGTRIDDSIPDDEDRVEQNLNYLIDNTEGLVMVGFAWKDLERYETVKKATIDRGRTPVFDPRLAYLLARLDRDIYAENASVFLERTDSMLYSPSDYVRSKHKAGLIDIDEWSNKPPIKTDTTHISQGVSANAIQKEPNKYVLHLDYFRFKNLLDINPPEGSVYIRAQCEPFNPRMELSETRMINWLKHFGINEKNNFEPYQIHASGHASGIELQEFVDNVKPKKLIPIHTLKPKLFNNKTGELIIPKIDNIITF